MFVFLLVFWYLYLEANYLVPGRLRNLEHHLVALELAGEIVGEMVMEQMMTVTMIVDGDNDHEDDDNLNDPDDDNHVDDDPYYQDDDQSGEACEVIMIVMIIGHTL